MGRYGENIRERADGRWEARIVQGAPVNGKTNFKYLYGRSYQDVRQKKNCFVLELISRGEYGKDPAVAAGLLGLSEKNPENRSKTEGLSFQTVSEGWLNSKKPTVKESTFAYYTGMVNTHLLPELGDLCIREINSEKLWDFLLRKKAKGRLKDGKPLAEKTVADLKTILKQIFTYAQSRGLVDSIPVCPAFTVRKPTVSVLTKAEQSRIEEVLRKEDTPFSLGILLSLYGGPRIGEVCALKWEDFDFENETVHIRRTVSRIKNVDDVSGRKTKVVLTSPKTESSMRTIPLPSPVFQYFRERRGADSWYMMTGSEKFMEPRTCRARYKRLLRRAGVADHTYHCLRHTYATHCVECGMDFKSLSEILGHSDVKITMQRYVHPSMDFKKEQVNRLPCFMESGQKRVGKS
ncbi:MAG: site-specific integrase [Clostridiales bacterium]|nr:site-specific integrase [Clostridiales bacterium]